MEEENKKGPKKLVRTGTEKLVKPGEIEHEQNRQELNKLYALKIQEELEEIKTSNHSDIKEYADIIQVALNWAELQGFSNMEVFQAINTKALEKGVFNDMVLTNLNPNNPSNKLYFDNDK